MKNIKYILIILALVIITSFILFIIGYNNKNIDNNIDNNIVLPEEKEMGFSGTYVAKEESLGYIRIEENKLGIYAQGDTNVPLNRLQSLMSGEDEAGWTIRVVTYDKEEIFGDNDGSKNNLAGALLAIKSMKDNDKYILSFIPVLCPKKTEFELYEVNIQNGNLTKLDSKDYKVIKEWTSKNCNYN